MRYGDNEGLAPVLFQGANSQSRGYEDLENEPLSGGAPLIVTAADKVRSAVVHAHDFVRRYRRVPW